MRIVPFQVTPVSFSAGDILGGYVAPLGEDFVGGAMLLNGKDFGPADSQPIWRLIFTQPFADTDYFVLPNLPGVKPAIIDETENGFVANKQPEYCDIIGLKDESNNLLPFAGIFVSSTG